MSKFKFSNYNDVMTKNDMAEAEKAAANKETIETITNAICNIGTDGNGVGDGGTKVLVKTEAYNTWLAEVQKRNRFIGKDYLSRAHEYERDDEEIDRAHFVENPAEMLAKDTDGKVHIDEEYDPNNTQVTDSEKLEGYASKFSDLCVINNVIAKQVSWDFDSLMDEVTDALKEEHKDDLDFELPENLSEQVDKALKRSEAFAQLTYSKFDTENNK
ncbi:MAG: hypothetical protein MJZ25_03850 [Fibrobacter sp.]|nr:hypothetical protein [Fibrobacter sp.]